MNFSSLTVFLFVKDTDVKLRIFLSAKPRGVYNVLFESVHVNVD